MNIPQPILKTVMQPYFAYAQNFRGMLRFGRDSFGAARTNPAPALQWKEPTFDHGLRDL